MKKAGHWVLSKRLAKRDLKRLVVVVVVVVRTCSMTHVSVDMRQRMQ